MEQLVINHLLVLLFKSGNEHLIREFFKGAEKISKYKNWTSEEIENLLLYLNETNKHFGKDNALSIIDSLIDKFSLSAEDFQQLPATKLSRDKMLHLHQ
jgi:hypothetical protein